MNTMTECSCCGQNFEEKAMYNRPYMNVKDLNKRVLVCKNCKNILDKFFSLANSTENKKDK
jgi:transposase